MAEEHTSSAMLKLLPAATLLIAMAIVSSASGAGLDALKWKARPVIVFAGVKETAADQIARLERGRAALDEREMSVFVVRESGVTTLSGDRAPSGFSAEALRQAYRVGPDDFAIVLVGKDGGEKLRSLTPIDVSKLTGLVDKMPMRRNEAR